MRLDAKPWRTFCPVALGVALLGVVAGIPACNDENAPLSAAEAAKMLGVSPLHYAALTNDAEKVKSLLADGSADINGKDDEAEQTPLHYAARAESVAVAEALVANGADINIKDKSNQLAFHLAADAGSDEIVKLLLDKGTDVHVADGGGRTALHLAANSGHLSVAKLLLDNGTDVHVADDRDQTALHLAANSGHLGIAKLLLDNGADPDASSRRGTPMHMAASRNREAVIKLLLERGADVNGNVGPGGGRTPLDGAYREGIHSLVEFLRSHGGREGSPRPGGAGGGRRRLDFAQLDANKDGKVTADEFQGPPQFFERLDANKDGVVTEEEIAAMRASRGERGRQGGGRGS